MFQLFAVGRATVAMRLPSVGHVARPALPIAAAMRPFTSTRSASDGAPTTTKHSATPQNAHAFIPGIAPSVEVFERAKALFYNPPLSGPETPLSRERKSYRDEMRQLRKAYAEDHKKLVAARRMEAEKEAERRGSRPPTQILGESYRKHRLELKERFHRVSHYVLAPKRMRPNAVTAALHQTRPMPSRWHLARGRFAAHDLGVTDEQAQVVRREFQAAVSPGRALVERLKHSAPTFISRDNLLMRVSESILKIGTANPRIETYRLEKRLTRSDIVNERRSDLDKRIAVLMDIRDQVVKKEAAKAPAAVKSEVVGSNSNAAPSAI
eukprot:Opistho-2@42994